MDFSIVVPVYNEEWRIPKNIDAIFSFFKNRPETSEIIFVNDGSTDKTAKVLSEYRQNYQFDVISYPHNRGKGFAVKQGALAAKGDWIIFFDIDLATPLSELKHFVELRRPGDQIIVGSRRLEGSTIRRGESGLRVFLGQGFTKISNLLVPEITDFTCGFKCFSRAAAQKIFSRAKIDRWGFDTELLYIAKINKIPVRQMPVEWAHDSDSRVNVIRAVISSFKELIEMKMNKLKGYYK